MTDEETDLLDLQVPGPTEGSLLNAEYVEVSHDFMFIALQYRSDDSVYSNT